MARLFIFEPNNARRLAATYRGLAKARHAEAVALLETTGNRRRFKRLLRDVDGFEEQARLAEAAADESERAIAGTMRNDLSTSV